MMISNCVFRLKEEKSEENQEYLTRLQALHGMSGFGVLGQNSRKDTPPPSRSSAATPTSIMDNLKLPAETEILRGRKGSVNSSYSNPLLSLPTGLTIGI